MSSIGTATNTFTSSPKVTFRQTHNGSFVIQIYSIRSQVAKFDLPDGGFFSVCYTNGSFGETSPRSIYKTKTDTTATPTLTATDPESRSRNRRDERSKTVGGTDATGAGVTTSGTVDPAPTTPASLTTAGPTDTEAGTGKSRRIETPEERPRRKAREQQISTPTKTPTTTITPTSTAIPTTARPTIIGTLSKLPKIPDAIEEGATRSAWDGTTLDDWTAKRVTGDAEKSAWGRYLQRREWEDWCYSVYPTARGHGKRWADQICTWLVDTLKSPSVYPAVDDSLVNELTDEICTYGQIQTGEAPDRKRIDRKLKAKLEELKTKGLTSGIGSRSAYTGQSMSEWTFRPGGDMSNGKTFTAREGVKRLEEEEAHEKWLKSYYERPARTGGQPARTLQTKQRTQISTWIQDRIDLRRKNTEAVRRVAYEKLEADPTWTAGAVTVDAATRSTNSSALPSSVDATSAATDRHRKVTFASASTGVADTAAPGTQTTTTGYPDGAEKLEAFISKRPRENDDKAAKRHQRKLMEWRGMSEANEQEYQNLKTQKLRKRAQGVAAGTNTDVASASATATVTGTGTDTDTGTASRASTLPAGMTLKEFMKTKPKRDNEKGRREHGETLDRWIKEDPENKKAYRDLAREYERKAASSRASTTGGGTHSSSGTI